MHHTLLGQRSWLPLVIPNCPNKSANLVWRSVILLFLLLLTPSDGGIAQPREPKLNILPFQRRAVFVHERVEFQCIDGRPPYIWERQVQSPEEMKNWRNKIRGLFQHCMVSSIVEEIPNKGRIWTNSTLGLLVFEDAHLNDTGIYRCRSVIDSVGEASCLELHFLVFEASSYSTYIIVIFGTVCFMAFVVSLCIVVQIRSAPWFSQSNFCCPKKNSSTDCQTENAFNPIIRFITSKPVSLASKSQVDSLAHSKSGDASQWPMLKQRQSSSCDSDPVKDEMRIELAIVPSKDSTCINVVERNAS